MDKPVIWDGKQHRNTNFYRGWVGRLLRDVQRMVWCQGRGCTQGAKQGGGKNGGSQAKFPHGERVGFPIGQKGEIKLPEQGTSHRPKGLEWGRKCLKHRRFKRFFRRASSVLTTGGKKNIGCQARCSSEESNCLKKKNLARLERERRRRGALGMRANSRCSVPTASGRRLYVGEKKRDASIMGTNLQERGKEFDKVRGNQRGKIGNHFETKISKSEIKKTSSRWTAKDRLED